MHYATVLGETLRQAPTRISTCSALAILLELARAGDVPAARTLGAVLAQKLGYQHAVPVIEGLQSLSGVLQEDVIPPLLRLYLLAFIPREFMFQVDAARKVMPVLSIASEYTQFQRLVRRDDVLQHEVLKAYCLAAFVATMRTLTEFGGARGNGGWQYVLDRIFSECQVVPGTSANTKFEIGHDLILRTTANGFAHVLFHEMGHHLFDLVMSARGDAAVADEEAAAPSADEFLALVNALPDTIRKALSRTDERAMPACLKGHQISLLVSVTEAQRGTYMHWSLTMMGAPIPLRTAVSWTALLLGLFGVSTADTAVAHSPRGVFHFGFARKIDPDGIAWPGDADEARRRLAMAQAVAGIWLEELIGANKIGPDAMSIPVNLGLQEPATRIFPDGSSALQDLQICEGLLSHGDSVDLSGEQAHLLMGVAMRCAYPALIKPLLDFGVRPEEYLREFGSSIGVAAPPDPSAKEYFGPTPANTFAMFSWLHEQGVNLDIALDETGTTLLLDAVRQESAGVSVLLALGADPNRADANGNTALHIAIGSSQRDLVEKVLQAGAEHDRRNAQGQTALALAAALDDADAVDLLLQRSADPDTRDAAGATPLMSALSGKVVRLLIASRAQPDAVDHTARTPLMAAAEGERAEVVRALLDAGADPERPDDLGYTALHYAAGNSGEATEDCLVALLDAGSEIDEETREGVTPLMVAAHSGSVVAVQVLLLRGANVNACDAGGNTPLILAVNPSQQLSRNPARSSQTEEVICALAESGADLDAQNDSGLSALHFAARAFTSTLARTLLGLGAAADPTSRDGQTPLMYAVAQGHDDIVTALIDAGADVNARDAKGSTPLHLAPGNSDQGSSENKQAFIGRLKARGARE